MATTQTNHSAPAIDAAFEQAKELNEQFVVAARKAGTMYVDSYEKAVARAIDLELKLAGLSQQDWLKNVIAAQADFTRELAESYATAARSLLK